MISTFIQTYWELVSIVMGLTVSAVVWLVVDREKLKKESFKTQVDLLIELHNTNATALEKLTVSLENISKEMRESHQILSKQISALHDSHNNLKTEHEVVMGICHNIRRSDIEAITNLRRKNEKTINVEPQVED